MTKEQVQMRLAQLGASYFTTKGAVEWWRLPNGKWVGVRQLPNGLYDARQFDSSCNC